MAVAVQLNREHPHGGRADRSVQSAASVSLWSPLHACERGRRRIDELFSSSSSASRWQPQRLSLPLQQLQTAALAAAAADAAAA